MSGVICIKTKSSNLLVCQLQARRFRWLLVSCQNRSRANVTGLRGKSEESPKSGHFWDLYRLPHNLPDNTHIYNCTISSTGAAWVFGPQGIRGFQECCFFHWNTRKDLFLPSPSELSPPLPPVSSFFLQPLWTNQTENVSLFKHCSLCGTLKLIL